MTELVAGGAAVHTAHGAGQITDRVERGDREFVVFIPLAGHGDLTVLVPREQVDDQLRPVGEVDAALAVVDEEPDEDTLRAHWRSRVAAYRARMTGDLTELAAAVRDLREAQRRDEAAGSRRSWLAPTEHELLDEAEGLLAAELAAARGEDLEEAEASLAA